MSVICFSESTFTAYAAGLVHCCKFSLSDALQLASLASRRNAEAYHARYDDVDSIEYLEADDLEAATLRLLADPEKLLQQTQRHGSGLSYNCDGSPFFAEVDWTQAPSEDMTRWKTDPQQQLVAIARTERSIEAWAELGEATPPAEFFPAGVCHCLHSRDALSDAQKAVVHVQVGQIVFCGLYGGKYGVVFRIDGEQTPETCSTMHGVMHSGGSANFNIVWDNGGQSNASESLVRGVQWKIFPNVLSQELTEGLLRFSAHSELLHKRQAAIKTAKRAANRKAIREANPHLTPTSEQPERFRSEQSSTARNIRAALKHAFPGIKFSVRKSYSGVDVSWTDGPSDSLVDPLVKRHKDSGFDSMTDSSYTIENDFADVFGGCQYPDTNRDLSCRDAVAEAFCESRGVEFKDVNTSLYENSHSWRETCGHHADELLSQVSFRKHESFHSAVEADQLETMAEIDVLILTADDSVVVRGRFYRRDDRPGIVFDAIGDVAADFTGERLPSLAAQKFTWQANVGELSEDEIQAAKPIAETAETVESPSDQKPDCDVSSINGITVTLNSEKNGVELSFNDKPAATVRNQLKAAGFRWSRKQGLWWARQNDATLHLADQLSGRLQVSQ